MIYDFEEHTPKLDPNSWVAPTAVIIGRVELKKNSNIKELLKKNLIETQGLCIMTFIAPQVYKNHML